MDLLNIIMVIVIKVGLLIIYLMDKEIYLNYKEIIMVILKMVRNMVLEYKKSETYLIIYNLMKEKKKSGVKQEKKKNYFKKQ